MAEAVWRGFLRLSLVSCPVRLAPATRDAHVIRLDQLNSRTGNPVTQQFVDSGTGEVVAANSVVRAYRTAASGYVTIGDAEFETLAGEARNIIEVAHFSRRDQIDRARLETSYYIYPDGQLAADTLDALRLAMQRTERDALAYLRLGERERMVLIQPYGAGLMLSTLRPPRVLEPAEFAARPDSAIPAEMIEIAEGIIQRHILEADANVLHDRYEDRLRSLTEQKSGGVGGPPPPTATAEAPTPEPVVSAAPSPEREPQGAVHAAGPGLQPAVAPSSLEPAPVPPPEAEAAITTGAPETAAASAPEREPAAEAAAAPIAAPSAEAVPPPAPEAEPPPERFRAPAAEPVVVRLGELTAAERRQLFDEAALDEAPSAALEGAGREFGTEILLHIMGLGDRRFIEPGWAGSPGSRRQIEAISIRPREEIEPSAIEFRVFAQEGRATAWVSNGNYAGTRGRQLPLTGFAVRPAPELRDRLDISYEGCFFDGGVVGPMRNGEICTSPVADDPLEAVRVSVIERASATD